MRRSPRSANLKTCFMGSPFCVKCTCLSFEKLFLHDNVLSYRISFQKKNGWEKSRLSDFSQNHIAVTYEQASAFAPRLILVRHRVHAHTIEPRSSEDSRDVARGRAVEILPSLVLPAHLMREVGQMIPLPADQLVADNRIFTAPRLARNDEDRSCRLRAIDLEDGARLKRDHPDKASRLQQFGLRPWRYAGDFNEAEPQGRTAVELHAGAWVVDRVDELLPVFLRWTILDDVVGAERFAPRNDHKGIVCRIAVLAKRHHLPDGGSTTATTRCTGRKPECDEQNAHRMSDSIHLLPPRQDAELRERQSPIPRYPQLYVIKTPLSRVDRTTFLQCA